MSQPYNFDEGRLVANSRAYRYDPVLDPAADKLEQGPEAWKDMPPRLVDLASIHLDFRNHYRAAVKAGVIPGTPISRRGAGRLGSRAGRRSAAEPKAHPLERTVPRPPPDNALNSAASRDPCGSSVH